MAPLTLGGHPLTSAPYLWPIGGLPRTEPLAYYSAAKVCLFDVFELPRPKGLSNYGSSGLYKRWCRQSYRPSWLRLCHYSCVSGGDGGMK